ncbi:MAG: FKBP-type peptidyl-prolyl cis-trans isomerase [Bacteroidales bacterium]|jgi:FKBP-type peptidyl-prolyl cis-trans isomerase FklB|nr:FKBP-type peptidyl-prolyl cis-trans isomerase [Bacteroidales bacterium]
MNELSYSLGVSVGLNLKEQGFSLDSVEDFAQALNDVLSGNNLAIPQEKVNAVVNEYFTELQKKRFEEKVAEGNKFLEENKNKDGVVTLESGLQYEVITEGDGAKPLATDMVTVHYTGTLTDGTVFDSSVQRGEPATFPVNGVIPGWVEALQLMPVGSKWKLAIPYNLAYGERGAGQLIGPYSTLVFEVELLSIQDK